MTLWLIVQLVALIVPAARVPLWAGFHQPGEDLALRVMTSAQLCAAALLAPIVLGSWPCFIGAAVAATLYIQLAAMLAATDAAQTLRAAAFVNGWLLALTLAMRATRCAAFARAMVVVAASCVTIGGSVLLYAQREYSNSQLSELLLSPIVASIEHLHEWRAWFFLICILIVSCCTLMMARRSGRRQQVAPIAQA